MIDRLNIVQKNKRLLTLLNLLFIYSFEFFELQKYTFHKWFVFFLIKKKVHNHYKQVNIFFI